jgi:hypothetical protein
MKRKIIAVGLGVLLLAVIGLVAATYTPGTIETARIAGDKARAIELNGHELGLVCISETKGCAELIARSEKNPRLKSAFLKAKAADIGILPNAWSPFSVGSIGEGYVTINTWYGDERIIAFLTK